jgi:hypothetical protein
MNGDITVGGERDKPEGSQRCGRRILWTDELLSSGPGQLPTTPFATTWDGDSGFSFSAAKH